MSLLYDVHLLIYFDFFAVIGKYIATGKIWHYIQEKLEIGL